MEDSEGRPGAPLGNGVPRPRDEPMYTGNGLQSCHLPSISRSICSRELEKVPEKADSCLTEVKRKCSTKCNHFLDSNRTSSGRRDSPSSSVETDLHVSEPPGLTRVCGHLDLATDLGQKSSFSHSDQSSEISLPDVQKDEYSEEFSLLKLRTKDGQRPEWTFYPRFSSNIHTYHVGKQCFFDGVFLRNRRSLSERTVDQSLGRKKYVFSAGIDSRNGIPEFTPGDNPYMFPEQSKGFHKVGSTLPPVNFSLVPYEKKFDTFIPLEPLPQVPNLPFWVKEKANNLKNEIREVEELDNWQPAEPLLQSLFPLGFLNLPKQF
ncbi:spermatogenesis-associated serine-rich protein 1 isoform X2 [Sciurus carolinensis]|uniref:spermatogenesis-associated serine-rich protein 1 isoform X2 n=1 Tax=Sciurus carolinensis TaxID=30640 RepID=UPI001FB44A36|nr:spermatogenesis-associated serine-rich protein 1 isoform X2 [Sciurus carolinensis]